MMYEVDQYSLLTKMYPIAVYGISYNCSRHNVINLKDYSRLTLLYIVSIKIFRIVSAYTITLLDQKYKEEN